MFTNNVIEKMQASELRDAIRVRNFVRNSVKPILTTKLKWVIVNGMVILEKISPNVISNMEKKIFVSQEPMADYE